jgi:hypothetical protein
LIDDYFTYLENARVQLKLCIESDDANAYSRIENAKKAADAFLHDASQVGKEIQKICSRLVVETEELE